MKTKLRKGDCYNQAALYVIGRPDDPVLVHGAIWCSDTPVPGLDRVRTGIEHAWVVEGETVWDHRRGRAHVTDRSTYYEQMRAEDLVRYTRDEATALMVEHGHGGPWWWG